MSLTQVSRYFEELGLLVTRAPTIAGASGTRHAPALLCEGPADAWTLVYNSARTVRGVDVVDAHIAAVDCDARAVVVSTGGYSPEARRWAARFHVSLLDWTDVQDAALEAARRTEEALAAAEDAATSAAPASEPAPGAPAPEASRELPVDPLVAHAPEEVIVDAPLLAESVTFDDLVAAGDAVAAEAAVADEEEIPLEALPFPIEDVEVEPVPPQPPPMPSLDFAMPEGVGDLLAAFTDAPVAPEPALAAPEADTFYEDVFALLAADGPVVDVEAFEPPAPTLSVAPEALVDAAVAEAPPLVVDDVPASAEPLAEAPLMETPVAIVAPEEAVHEAPAPAEAPVVAEPAHAEIPVITHAVEVAPADPAGAPLVTLVEAPASPLPWPLVPREAPQETSALLATGAAFLTGSASRLADLRKSLEDTGANSFGENAHVDMDGASLWLRKLQKRDAGQDLL